MIRIKYLFFLFLLCSFFEKKAFAYVDPGLGGLIFQIGYILFTSLIVGFTFLFKPIKNFFKKNKKQK